MSARTVLIVDDAEESRVTLEMALQSLAGVVVVGVRSAEEALRVLRGDRVVALISDIQLGGMSGLQLLAEARGVPAIVVSAAAGPDVSAEAMRAGAAAFFSKPFSPAAVCKKVEEILKEFPDA
jgi:DNA-binding NtrC family response regulator